MLQVGDRVKVKPGVSFAGAVGTITRNLQTDPTTADGIDEVWEWLVVFDAPVFDLWGSCKDACFDTKELEVLSNNSRE